ncbi:hypothetical protein BASA61_010160 [Batrachochytrium salamandrivorans]|nr:hypothetical protein BASA62_008875 [Batrachochytrium salamandrivorans]KAH6571746.1 hypothetical protein BASA60_007004 [Batrachochytrium salamandrivorans]KAH6579527.1 hypothetical protein BASA61_010160 [Batrachochytrium salamandrivorans]
MDYRLHARSKSIPLLSHMPLYRLTCHVLAIAVAALLVPSVTAFYLPGVAPHDYPAGEAVPLLVNSLSATDSLISFDYYYNQLHLCRPVSEPIAQRESLGSILFGDRLYTSPFEIHSLQNKTCTKLCDTTIPAIDTDFVRRIIEEEYTVNWVVDGLPVAQLYKDLSTNENYYSAGFDFGKITDSDQTIVNNHYNIIIHYHMKNEKARVVGVLVQPTSGTKDVQDAGCDFSASSNKYILQEGQDNAIQYTYSTFWVVDPISWGTRWDHYLHVFDPQIHWFSIINSIVIVLILGSMVTMILLRTLHKDIARYNSIGDEDGAQEEFGWKMVHADVFRPPMFRMLLSVLVGNGAQLLYMGSVTLVFAVLGFLSPSSRGALGTMALVFYVLFSTVSGYISAVLYKTLQGEHWRKNVVLTAVLVPGIIFGVLLILNFFLIARNSSSAVPFGTLLALVAMWFLISIPLCIAGAYFGFRHPGYEHPCKTNQIPRQIPPQPVYLNKYYSALIGGVLPFGAIFIELYFIMSSIWSHRIYYMFGFLLFVFVILIMTCSLVSVLLCYFQLCAEDYMWSWRSFMTSGASGFYIMLYSIVYAARRLHLVDFSSLALYFTWSLVISLMFTVFTGTVGYVSAFAFIRVIYSAIKVD